MTQRTVDETMARIDEALAKIAHDSSIWCPWCATAYEDEGHCVSFWGEDAPVEAQCGHCEKMFEVHETVVRSYETKKITPTQEW